MLLKKGVPVGFIFNKIRVEIIIITIYTFIVLMLDQHFALAYISIPLSITSTLGTAISLLLAFRINQAYERWWEARKIWGAIVNDSRSLIRQYLTFMPDSEQDPSSHGFTKNVAYRQIMWCYALGESLRGKLNLEDKHQYLTADEFAKIKLHQNVPNALLLMHGGDLKFASEKNWVNDFQQVEIDKTLSRLTDSMGMAERLKNTVFPTTYSLFVEFLLYLFVIFLPIGLMEQFEFFTLPMSIVISCVFFLVEKSAIHMQNPFEDRPTDTPVTSIARTIEINLRQMLEEDSVPDKLKPKKFYID